MESKTSTATKTAQPSIKRILAKLSGGAELEEEFLVLLGYLASISTAYPTYKDLFEQAASFPLRNKTLKRVLKSLISSVSMGYTYVEACAHVAKMTKNSLVRNFFERLSQAMAMGNPLPDFFKRELESYRTEYADWYERQIRDLAFVREIFTAITASITFISISMMVLILIFPGEPHQLLMAVAIAGIMAMSVIICLAKLVTPADRLMHGLPRKTKEQRLIRKVLPLSAVTAGVIFFLLYTLIHDLTLVFWGLSFILTALPFVPAGLLGKVDEREVKTLDQNFPAFIRSLGSTASSVGLSFVYALKTVKEVKFGSLTRHVKRLYNYLAIGADPKVAWERFEGDTGSELIHRYSEVFSDSVSSGGHAEEVGNLINTIFLERLNLRARRHLVYSSLRGLIYPLQATFIMIITFMNMITKVFLNFMASYSLSTGFIGPPTVSYVALDAFSLVLMLTITLADIAALKIIGLSNMFSLTLEISLLFIVMGASITLTYVGTQMLISRFIPGVFPAGTS